MLEHTTLMEGKTAAGKPHHSAQCHLQGLSSIFLARQVVYFRFRVCTHAVSSDYTVVARGLMKLSSRLNILFIVGIIDTVSGVLELSLLPSFHPRMALCTLLFPWLTKGRVVVPFESSKMRPKSAADGL